MSMSFFSTSALSCTGKLVACLLLLLVAYSVYHEYALTESAGKPTLHKPKFRMAYQKQVNVYTKRRRVARDACQHSRRGSVGHIYIHHDTNMAYCPVAKAGCTFWIRIFRFLNNDTGSYPSKTPFQMSRMFVHYGSKKNTPLLEYNSTNEQIVSDYTRFLFSRNPYSRLWSAYLDKFYLPDFWRTFARFIVKARSNITAKAAKCAHDVTFKEFLKYILSNNVTMLNGHWRPIKYICDPCIYKPDIIGKMESFSEDARYILKGIGREWIMNNNESNTNDEEELNTLTDYNFQLLSAAYFEECLTPPHISQLLWTTFQMNGYLPMEVSAESVVERLNAKKLNKKTFKEFVLKTHTSATPEKRKQWKLQKRAALVKAYQHIPYSIITGLQKLFKDDFELFGYDKNPPS